MCLDSLGRTNYKMVEFRILRGRKKDRNTTATPDFMDLLGRIPQDTALVRRRFQESWFKDHEFKIKNAGFPFH